MWDLCPLTRGIEHAPSRWKLKILTTGPPGTSPNSLVAGFFLLSPSSPVSSLAFGLCSLLPGKRCPVLFSVLRFSQRLCSLASRIQDHLGMSFSCSWRNTSELLSPRASRGSLVTLWWPFLLLSDEAGQVGGGALAEEKKGGLLFRAVNTERSEAVQTQSKLDALAPQSVPWNDLQASRSLVRASALWSVISDRTPGCLAQPSPA